MKQALIYSLKVWLTGDLLAFTVPCAYIVIRGIHLDMPLIVLIEFSLSMILLSLAFAVPFCVCVMLVVKLTWHNSLKKLLLSFISFPLGWLPIMIFVIGADNLDRLSTDRLRDVFVYIFCNFIAIWVYKLDAAPHESLNSPKLDETSTHL